MKNAYRILVLTSALLPQVLCGCGAKKQPQAPTSRSELEPNSREVESNDGDSQKSHGVFSSSFSSIKSVDYIPLAGKPDALVMPGQARNSAHSKYVKEKPEFKPIPQPAREGFGELVVVGSEVARFYPNASVSKNEDLKKLGAGTPVAIGTLITVGDFISASDSDYEGYFQLDGQYNYFYPTVYKGKKGLVFGADLCRLEGAEERSVIAALRYQTGGRMTDFYPIFGLDELSDSVRSKLVEDRIAFEKVAVDSYPLEAYYPDDMLSLYQHDAWDSQRCLFITTDLVSHSIHLFFDRYLQVLEEDFFTPRLGGLIDAYLVEIDRLISKDTGAVKEYSRTLALARLYFEVPRAVLEAAPDRLEDQLGLHQYGSKNAAEIYEKYSGTAQEILNLIDTHAGWETIPEFLYKEDFSQYAPRGHYTRNGVLEAYFKAMMWFGRVHMYIADADPPPLVWIEKDDTAKASATELSLQLTPVAVFLCNITGKNPELLRKWRDIFDPITYLVGISDDLSFEEVMPFIEKEKIKDLPSWTADEKGIIDMVRRASKTLRSPLIAGNSVKHVPSGEDLAPPMGWRLFGQRFTYDSAVHQNTSSPRLEDINPATGRKVGRIWVSGLDIMRAFGSRAAEELLAAWDNGYAGFPSLRGILEGLDKEFSGYPPEFWGKTYYNRSLFLMKSQAQFESGAGFYFTETPLWDTKALISAHGTWAELRHDTILYAKQVYGVAEAGGFGGPSWRIKELPEPIHYIEPNLAFFTGARQLIRDLYENTAASGLLPRHYADLLESMDTLLGNSVRIVRAETEDKPISTEDNRFISSIPQKLANIVSGMDYYGTATNPEDLKMAIIADVYTCFDDQAVLEVGVGIPHRLWLLLSDGQGGKRVASGYTFSYYEFRHPLTDRMTDERWKDKVYDPDADLTEYEAFWASGLVN